MDHRIHSRYRYDFFTIWGNGLSHAEAILNILRKERNLEIVRIETRRIEKMRRFVFDLYACDTVPMRHLHAKLAYLLDEHPEIVIVLVKNLAPEESIVGEGPFRHVQCCYINRIKETIRDLYNPRLNGVRTEEHVIHASDHEEQVDYLVKMLGDSRGLKFLGEDSSGLPFRKPYHIPRPSAYAFKSLPVEGLWASILVDLESRVDKTKLVKIGETPHFQTLTNGGTAYVDYLRHFRHTWLTDDHTWDKLLHMNQLSERRIKDFDPILVTQVPEGFKILDGVHRAAVTLAHRFDTIKCVDIQD
ncbi:MAG: hypothetical protein ACE5HC_00845 [Candidatus Binatia bacterium]